jgi:hypothetical protein
VSNNPERLVIEKYFKTGAEPPVFCTICHGCGCGEHNNDPEHMGDIARFVVKFPSGRTHMLCTDCREGIQEAWASAPTDEDWFKPSQLAAQPVKGQP